MKRVALVSLTGVVVCVCAAEMQTCDACPCSCVGELIYMIVVWRLRMGRWLRFGIVCSSAGTGR